MGKVEDDRGAGWRRGATEIKGRGGERGKRIVKSGKGRGACRRSRRPETPRMLRERYCRRDGVPASRIIVAFAIAAAIRAKLDLNRLSDIELSRWHPMDPYLVDVGKWVHSSAKKNGKVEECTGRAGPCNGYLGFFTVSPILTLDTDF